MRTCTGYEKLKSTRISNGNQNILSPNQIRYLQQHVFYTHAILANNLNQFTKTQGVGSVTTGVGIATAIAVWPYVAAYVRGKISKEKLEIALIKVFPEAGKELAYRIGFIAIFGPIYAWWILAKTAMSLTPSPKDNIGKIRYIMINN